MIIAKMGNAVYQIDEGDQDAFQARGYDIFTEDSNGNRTLVTKGRGGPVSPEEHEASLNQIDSLNKELTDTKADLAKKSSELSSTQSKLNSTTSELNSTKTELSNTKTELTSTKSELSSTKTELTNTKAELATTKSDLEECENRNPPEE